MFQYLSHKAIPKNIWLGVTVDNRKEGLPRIDKLRNLQASVLFLSVVDLPTKLRSLCRFKLTTLRRSS